MDGANFCVGIYVCIASGPVRPQVPNPDRSYTWERIYGRYAITRWSILANRCQNLQVQGIALDVETVYVWNFPGGAVNCSEAAGKVTFAYPLLQIKRDSEKTTGMYIL